MSLFQELRRRNVFRVAIAYIVTVWLLLQVADVIINNIGAPDWVFQVIMLVFGLGFPVVLLGAWAYELTPDGIKKESEVGRSESITSGTGHKLNVAVVAVLIVALGYFVFDKFVVGVDQPPARSVALSDEAGRASSPKVAGSAIAAPDKSIAVLPFVNMSSDPEQEFFSDGIAEELLNVLAQFPKLRVAARTSSFQFKGQNQDIGEIAATLKVSYVLEGSVRKSGTRLRITAQLIKADDGYHLWSETYDRELDDVFAIQDEIAGAISAALQVQLELGDSAVSGAIQPAIIHTANTQAYEAFLRGRRLIHQRGRESLEDAVRHLERALRLDANYAPAHAQLAIATMLLLESPTTYGNLSQAEVQRRAVPHLERALELAPNLATAHAAQALYNLQERDPQSVLRHTRKALQINPSYTDAMNWQQIALGDMGRYREALDLIEQILEADPLTVVGRLNYANDQLGRGNIAEAHAIADSLLEQSPWASYSTHAQAALYFEAQIAKSVFWVLQAYAADPGDLLSNRYLVDAFVSIGEFNEARRVSDALVAWVNLTEGRIDDALAAISRKRQTDPENSSLLLEAADTKHFARRFEPALSDYEQLARQGLPGRPIEADLMATIRLAYHRQRAGEDARAAEAIRVVQNDVSVLEELGYRGPYLRTVKAMLAAQQGEVDAALAALRLAVDAGLRLPIVLTDPVFDRIKDEQRFIDIETDVLQALESEREQTLQLICFNNPVPGAWQPLPETCDGVAAQKLEL